MIGLRKRTNEEVAEYLRIRRLPPEIRMKMAHESLSKIWLIAEKLETKEGSEIREIIKKAFR